MRTIICITCACWSGSCPRHVRRTSRMSTSSHGSSPLYYISSTTFSTLMSYLSPLARLMQAINRVFGIFDGFQEPRGNWFTSLAWAHCLTLILYFWEVTAFEGQAIVTHTLRAVPGTQPRILRTYGKPSHEVRTCELVPIATIAHPQLTTLDSAIEERLRLRCLGCLWS